MNLLRELWQFSRTIRLAHSLFALPFALGAAWLAEPPHPEWRALALIVLCMVAARTAAMGMNRIADAPLDARNPRTAHRAIPAGRLRRRTALALTLASGGVFLVAAWGFRPLRQNAWPGLLAPPILALLLAYPYAKRVTALAHWLLGMCLGLAPVGAWLALRGALTTPPLIIAAAVTFWTAGFDILYALQDEAFDRQAGLRSVPARLGPRGARWVAIASHAVMLLLLAWLPLRQHAVTGLAFDASLGVVAILALLVAAEHAAARFLRPQKLAPLVFRLSAAMSILWAAGIILDVRATP